MCHHTTCNLCWPIQLYHYDTCVMITFHLHFDVLNFVRLTMSELFEMICEKENLIPAEHQLSLPRTGARKVTFDSGTAIGSLKIREVAIIRTVMTSQNIAGSVKVEDESVADLLDAEGEEVMV